MNTIVLHDLWLVESTDEEPWLWKNQVQEAQTVNYIQFQMEQRVDTPTLLLFKAQLYYYSGSAKQDLPESKIYRTCLQNTGHQGIWKRAMRRKGFPDGSMVRNLPANAGDAGEERASQMVPW